MSFLSQALVILALPLVCWWPLRRLVPLVLVQILCGIAAGPTLLGRWLPALHEQLFPHGATHDLAVFSNLAIVCVGFLAGMELDPDELRQQARSVLGIGFASFALPALGGALFAFWSAHRWPLLLGPSANPWTFAGAGAICFGVTALPVLAAILRELGLFGTRLGRIALALAAINDVLLWTMLSVLMLALPGAHQPFAYRIGLLIALIAFLSLLRFLLVRTAREARSELSTTHFTLVLIGLFACARLSELLGLHAVIGAFLAGAIMPKPMRERIAPVTAPFSNAVLLPFFFVSAGLAVDLATPPLWTFFAASVLIGSGLKILSTAVPARSWGWPWSEALRLGALMQSRGLMEIVVLGVLYEVGIISQGCLSALLLMALVTTGLAMPLTRWLAAAPKTSSPITVCETAAR